MMKKSLIALAALAAVGAASAQSSVTVYGRVVAAVMKDTQGQGARIDTSNGTSQLGFRGVEDLGGGMKATFDLRHRFSTESGNNDGTANGRPFWQGSSKVGLAGGFGSVDIGRMLTAVQGPINATDPWGTETVASVAALASGYSADFRQADGAGLGRTDVITYTSPNMGGFTGAFSYGPKTSAAVAPRTVGTKNFMSVWAGYANGPLMVGGGYEQNRSDDDITVLLGSFDFGVAKLMGGYSQVNTVAIAGSKRKNYNLAMSAPLGPVLLKAGYFNTKNEGTGLKSTKFGVGAEYNLSKRTYLFTGLGKNKGPAFTGLTGAPRKTASDMGVSHSF
ncbi:MAG TPA: porin [Ramlibacter sp.]|nr:porin [Ramlibacter sp.]